MDIQALITTLLVTACAVYALWALLPMAAKRPLARALLRLRWPTPLSSAPGRAAAAGCGCSCDGCDAGAGSPARRTQGSVPMRFHPRRR